MDLQSGAVLLVKDQMLEMPVFFICQLPILLLREFKLHFEPIWYLFNLTC